MDVVNEPLGWRVLKIAEQSPTSFMATALYWNRRRWIKGVIPPFDYTATAPTAEAAKRECLRLAAADREWPLMLDTTMPGVHDWSLGRSGKMECAKCKVPQSGGHLGEPCAG